MLIEMGFCYTGFSGLKQSNSYIKQLLDEVFVISGIIKVEVSVISRSRRLRLITLTEIHCFKANYDKRIIAPNTVYFRHAMFLLRCP